GCSKLATRLSVFTCRCTRPCTSYFMACPTCSRGSNTTRWSPPAAPIHPASSAAHPATRHVALLLRLATISSLRQAAGSKLRSPPGTLPPSAGAAENHGFHPETQV